jgi:hypothetical protein
MTGDWPSSELLSLDAQHITLAAALQRVAKQLGLTLVLPANLGDQQITVVTGKPRAAKSLVSALLAGVEQNVVAHREGDTLYIRVVAPPSPTASAAPSIASPSPAASAAPSIASPSPAASALPADNANRAKRAPDRTTNGQNLRIEAGETVHDVSAVGGMVDIFGEVTGDVVVTGGSIVVHKGGKVAGDVSTLGGSVTMEDDSAIDGDVHIVGGRLDKMPSSLIRGDVHSGVESDEEVAAKKPLLQRIGDGVSHALSTFSILFLLGALLLALLPQRMEAVRAEVAMRPMRALALGVLGLLGFSVAFVVLCVTLIGIPVAVVGACLGTLAMLAGVTSGAQLVGEMFLRHRNQNAYVHLAAGCAALTLIGCIPYLGGLAWLAAILIGVGSMVATRVGGLLSRKPVALPAEGPYRTNM